MNTIKKLIVFTIILSFISGIYVLFAPHQATLPHSSWRHGVGETAGGVLAWLLALIYGRTLLKIILHNGPIMDRLLPEGTWETATPFVKKIMPVLNRTHPYIGAAAVVMVGVHGSLEGFSRANLLLLTIFVLASWQFGFGLFLLQKYQAVYIKKLKRYGYMAHSQLYTGIAIAIFALFGHLLLGD